MPSPVSSSPALATATSGPAQSRTKPARPTAEPAASTAGGRPIRPVIGPAAARAAAIPTRNSAANVGASPGPAPCWSAIQVADQNTRQNSALTASRTSNQRPSSGPGGSGGGSARPRSTAQPDREQAGREQARVERDGGPGHLQVTLQRGEHRAQPVQQEGEAAELGVQQPRRPAPGRPGRPPPHHHFV